MTKHDAATAEVPEDEKCPDCRRYLSYDDGHYYCDNEDTKPRCRMFLKRYYSP